MAWTTSAHPWANGLAAGAISRAAETVSAVRQWGHARGPANLVRLLGAAHLVFLAAVVDLAPLDLLLLASGTSIVLLLLLLQAPAETETAATTDHAAAPPSVSGAQRAPVTGSDLDHITHAELMARISHELRTPLNAIIGFSDLMGGELYGPMGHPRYREHVGHIRDSGRELLRSAEDTLAITALLARHQNAETRQSLELRSLVGEAWQHAGTRSRGRAIGMEATGVEDVEVLGDRRGLRQTISNLMAEAAARCGEAGRVSVSTQSHGGIVRLAISVPSRSDRTEPRSTSLPACLARTMIELQGASLVETFDGGAWTANVYLDEASQAELFGA